MLQTFIMHTFSTKISLEIEMRNAGDVFVHSACDEEDVKDVFGLVASSKKLAVFMVGISFATILEHSNHLGQPSPDLHRYNGSLTWKHVYIPSGQ